MLELNAGLHLTVDLNDWDDVKKARLLIGHRGIVVFRDDDYTPFRTLAWGEVHEMLCKHLGLDDWMSDDDFDPLFADDDPDSPGCADEDEDEGEADDPPREGSSFTVTEADETW